MNKIYTSPGHGRQGTVDCLRSAKEAGLQGNMYSKNIHCMYSGAFVPSGSTPLKEWLSQVGNGTYFGLFPFRRSMPYFLIR